MRKWGGKGKEKERRESEWSCCCLSSVHHRSIVAETSGLRSGIHLFMYTFSLPPFPFLYLPPLSFSSIFLLFFLPILIHIYPLALPLFLSSFPSPNGISLTFILPLCLPPYPSPFSFSLFFPPFSFPFPFCLYSVTFYHKLIRDLDQ